MRFFGRKKRKKRKVWGFLADPRLPLAVKLLARDLEVPMFSIAEHALELGIAQMYPFEDEQFKTELQCHLINEHLLAPALNARNDYDEAMTARIRRQQEDHRERVEAAFRIFRFLELCGVPRETVKAELKRLAMEARKR